MLKKNKKDNVYTPKEIGIFVGDIQPCYARGSNFLFVKTHAYSGDICFILLGDRHQTKGKYNKNDYLKNLTSAVQNELEKPFRCPKYSKGINDGSR